MTTNICPKCGCPIFEELYLGTVSPNLCKCEAVRIWRSAAVETTHFRYRIDDHAYLVLDTNAPWLS